MAPPQRLKIDSLPPVTKRPVEMQVLCLGMSRAATMSLKSALTTLGYKTYHASEIAASGVEHPMIYWKEGIENKYLGKGRPYGRPEFDKLLKNYSAVTDIPCILFVDELLAAYPDAKVVLNTRDPDSWLASMEKTFYVLIGWKSVDYLGPFDIEAIGGVWWMLHAALDIWTDTTIGTAIPSRHDDRTALRRGFEQHYAHVRAAVPRAKLLEFSAAQGWGPLCEFLGREAPTGEPFPHVNDAEALVGYMRYVWWVLVVRVVMKGVRRVVAPVVVAVGVVGWGVWWARRSGGGGSGGGRNM